MLIAVIFLAIHQAFLPAVTSVVEPQTFNQAMKDIKWRDAMENEGGDMEENHTWTIEDLPTWKKFIASKWFVK